MLQFSPLLFAQFSRLHHYDVIIQIIQQHTTKLTITFGNVFSLNTIKSRLFQPSKNCAVLFQCGSSLCNNSLSCVKEAKATSVAKKGKSYFCCILLTYPSPNSSSWTLLQTSYQYQASIIEKALQSRFPSFQCHLM